MLIFLYDGTFEGMLTCIYDGYYNKNPDKIINNDLYQQNFLDEVEFIYTDIIKSNKVLNAIITKLSEGYFDKIIRAFCSEDYDIATNIYKLLKLSFIKGADIIMCVSNDIVLNVIKNYTSVVRETHLLYGIIRFTKLKGEIYYSQFSPTYNQLPLLISHFVERFSNQVWVLHDIKRNMAIFYDKKNWYINEFYGNDSFKFSEDEELSRLLWKEFHKKIAIKDRINKKLQMNYIPKKYWRYLVEMN